MSALRTATEHDAVHVSVQTQVHVSGQTQVRVSGHTQVHVSGQTHRSAPTVKRLYARL